jgi:hypothetical protein
MDEAPRPPSEFDWPAIAAQLMANPYEWARIFSQGRKSVANALRQGSIVVLRPAYGFQFRTRNNRPYQAPTTCDLYARYNPEKDTRVQ